MKSLFESYAFMAVRGAVLMTARRRKYRDATAEELHDKHVDPQPRPDQTAVTTDDQRREWQLQWLQSALRELPPDQAEIVCGIYFEGADPDELAARMGLTACQLGSRRRLALKQLKKMRPSEPVFSTQTARRRQPQTPSCGPVRPPLNSPASVS